MLQSEALPARDRGEGSDERHRLHRLISMVFEPSLVAMPLILWLVYTRRHLFSIELWKVYVVLAFVGSFIPTAYTLTLMRLGLVSTFFYRNRRERIYFFPMLVVCLFAVFVFFAYFSTSRALPAAAFAGMVVAVGLGFLTLRHKISYHLAGLGGIVSIAAALVGLPAIFLLPLLVLVAYSRTRLGAHTWLEVTVGGAYGIITSAVAFRWFYEGGYQLMAKFWVLSKSWVISKPVVLKLWMISKVWGLTA